MTIVQAIVLGVVQGLTEFLPVSSHAHLVIVQYFFGLKGPVLLVFDVVVHIGTLIAIFIYFAKEFFPVPKIGARMFGLITLATLPTAIIGFLMRDWMEQTFDALWLVAVTLLANSIILWSTRWVQMKQGKGMQSPLDAIWIGIAQGISILPGISRSGATVTTALWLGVKSEEAVRFSFFIAIPAILGVTVLVLPESMTLISNEMWLPMIVGFVSALASGYLAISLLFKVVSKGKFHDFALYTFVLAIITFLFAFSK